MDEERFGKYFKPPHVYIPMFKLNRMLDYCKLLNFPSLNILVHLVQTVIYVYAFENADGLSSAMKFIILC